jgi:Spx/MgsR family transcriptional regulator
MIAEIVLYGLKSCDSCRRARRWLDDHAADYRFVDIRQFTPDVATLENWCETVGWETLLNRRSATWRELDESLRTGLDRMSAGALAAEHPTLIKRPVLTIGGTVAVVGFDPVRYSELLAKSV